MAQYLGIVKLGGFYNNGTILPRPTNPWRSDVPPYIGCGVGNIPQMYGEMANYMIGNTPTVDADKLQWVKIVDGDKTILICDRVILVSVSWDDLNGQGYITGKEITIDDAKYKCRLLTGGYNRRNNDHYAGGLSPNNEWDRFVTREEVISGLPAPVSFDLDSTLNATDKSSAHSQLWNWMGIYTWCRETYTDNTSTRAIRGHDSARRWDYNAATGRNAYIGFRPVLEVLNTAPLISDTDKNLGDKNSNFTITYTVNDSDTSDVLTVTEYRDSTQTNTFTNAVRGQTYSITVPVVNMSLGTHTISVTAIDGKGGTSTRVWTFQRVNAVPTISGSDQSLGDKNLGFQIDYTVNDTDNDTLTVTEKLNSETLRTINNAPKEQALTIEISNQKLYSLGLNSVNTIQISVNDGKGGTAYRTYTFKRTNTSPGISGTDIDLGQQTGAFSKAYTIADVEGDTVIVTERIDDTVIRSYTAQLGTENSITLTEDRWLTLANGIHALKIEAVDDNFATSIRVFNFSKNETQILFEFPTPFETDAKAGKILITPTWHVEGAEVHVYACNNAFDDNPTWEEITPQVVINRVYNFANETKIASTWGVNVRFHIVKNLGYEGEVSISGFGGAFE